MTTGQAGQKFKYPKDAAAKIKQVVEICNGLACCYTGYTEKLLEAL
jgi:hypothetical protein